MCNFPRMTCLFIALMLAGSSAGSELRWSFDSLPPDSLVGDASIEPIGPSAKNFKGLPAANDALRLDGKGDYVRVADAGEESSLDFSKGDPISIEAWVRISEIDHGQNVYIVGKGRTHTGGHKDNQNYALRMRGVSGDARVSFLFRSESTGEHKSDWHRWTSKRGFPADGVWHHVAVTYQFGDSESIHGYVDGTSVSGSWDMGGATDRGPVVDDDDLWIGSSMGGAAGSSLHGAIDEVVVHRTIIPSETFAGRRIVILHPPQRPAAGLKPGVVTLSLYEEIGSEAVWPLESPSPLVQYEQTAFAIPRIPIPYGDGGVRRDWSAPLMISAMAEIDLPAGEIQWMLRAGGLSRLWVGDSLVAETPVHLGNTSGHGEVTHDPPGDPWLRPPRAGHHEKLATHSREKAGPTLVALETMIGGKRIRCEAGEILVAYRLAADQQWQILSLDDSYEVTDRDWRRLADQIDLQVQQVDDRQRRAAASVEDRQWDARHDRARQWVQSLASLEIPSPGETPVAAKPVDRFVNSRIVAAGPPERENSETDGTGTFSPMTTDHQFIRRLYLDCVGVIPTPEEISAFESFDGNEKQRREKLIDVVLKDPRWADHWTAYWLDVLAENPNVLKPTLNNSGPFRWYLYDVLRDNVAVDRWVTGLIRMNGSARGGGPAGFALAAENDVPMAAKAHIVSSAFLGANMKCARCHDAPYHDWTQKDLFSIAAMLAKKPIEVPATSSVPQDFFAGEPEDEGLITLSLKPGEEVAANWPLADYTSPEPLTESAAVSTSGDSREQLAMLLTRAENQQFSKTIVNRLWQRMMGEGIVEPIGDWEGASASHPALLDHLARELTANSYDFKHVARLILCSHAYQRTATDRPLTGDASKRLFVSPRLRRMSAEQLVDSIHVAVGRAMDAGELTFDPEARMSPAAHGNLGRPRRAWQLTSLSNERDRPALSLPNAAAVVDCLEAFGWKGARQEPINDRQSDANVLQPGILSGGILSIQLTRLTDGDAVTNLCLQATTPEQLIDDLFMRFLTRLPTDHERQRFVAIVADGFETRVLETPLPAETPIREPNVSWANHLHPEATDVRLRESGRLRRGPAPTLWLQPNWRERAEDVIWALMNTPEFLFTP